MLFTSTNLCAPRERALLAVLLILSGYLYILTYISMYISVQRSKKYVIRPAKREEGKVLRAQNAQESAQIAPIYYSEIKNLRWEKVSLSWLIHIARRAPSSLLYGAHAVIFYHSTVF
jgi:hypothetical protein